MCSINHCSIRSLNDVFYIRANVTLRAPLAHLTFTSMLCSPQLMVDGETGHLGRAAPSNVEMDNKGEAENVTTPLRQPVELGAKEMTQRLKPAQKNRVEVS